MNKKYLIVYIDLSGNIKNFYTDGKDKKEALKNASLYDSEEKVLNVIELGNSNE